ncbi:MAG: hypothetical protein N3B21_14025 [Clostridia bacterium]|nr:hypothetical protein [Clostridia bacterium]
MKSEIMFSYDFKNEYLVCSLIAITDETAIALARSEKSGEYHLLLLEKEMYFSINISQRLGAIKKYMLSLKNLQTRMSLSTFGKGFALIIMEYVYIWEDFFQDCKEYVIVNNFESDKASRFINPSRASGIDNQDSIIFSLTDYFYNNVARYYCILDIKDNIASWSKLDDNFMYKELPYSQYPSTNSPIRKGWLVIQDLCVKDNNIFFYTVGEEKNHYKYGMDFCILSKNDLNGDVISLKETEKGYGYFTTSKDYLVVHSLKSKAKLYLYNLENDEEEILTLSAKKNLGHLNNDFLKIDSKNHGLWIYNADGITCCRMEV